MPALISLRAVVDALEMQNDQCGAYLDPKTGEILTVTHEDEKMIEEGYDEAELPQWQVDSLKATREFLQRGGLLLLPSAFEIHEWQIMNDFAEEQKNDRTRYILSRALHGSGAFRHFKHALYDLGIEKAWFQYRSQALEEIAREWLEHNHLPYTVAGGADSQ